MRCRACDHTRVQTRITSYNVCYTKLLRLHALVVSHADRDHSANWQRIWTALPVARLISSHRWTSDTQVCLRGQHWRWGSLTLEVLSPWQATDGQRNEDSCVLRIIV